MLLYIYVLIFDQNWPCFISANLFFSLVLNKDLKDNLISPGNINTSDKNTFILLTKFEVHTVSYGPHFSPLIFGPSLKPAGHESKRKKQLSITYSVEQGDEVS